LLMPVYMVFSLAPKALEAFLLTLVLALGSNSPFIYQPSYV